MTKQQHIISKGLAKIEAATEILATQENKLVRDLAKDLQEGIEQIHEGLELKK